MLQLVIDKTSAKGLWLCLAALLFCMLVQSLKRKLGPGNLSQQLPVRSACLTVGTAWGHWPQKADSSIGLEGCGWVTFSSPVTSIACYFWHGALPSHLFCPNNAK